MSELRSVQREGFVLHRYRLTKVELDDPLKNGSSKKMKTSFIITNHYSNINFVLTIHTIYDHINCFNTFWHSRIWKAVIFLWVSSLCKRLNLSIISYSMDINQNNKKLSKLLSTNLSIKIISPSHHNHAWMSNRMIKEQKYIRIIKVYNRIYAN